ncbi:MAG: iron-containing alcohol dehydrogenase [Eubacteriales bacterium]
MHEFTQYAPTEIVFGEETELQAGSLTKKWGASRVLIVYGGGSVVKSGLLDRVKTSLSDANLYFEELGGVQPNPRLQLAREGVAQAIAMKADFILAVGGGSAIDTAKGIALGSANPTLDLWDDIWLGATMIPQSIPVGVILTLSAAGSETSDSAVLTNEATGTKQGLSVHWNRPKFAIMNPELTYTIPKRQLSCGIVDIMMHTLDRYFTPKQANELTDQIAESVLRVTVENGRIAYENQTDYSAMSEIMWAGSVSHNGMTGLGGLPDFATHRIGHELSAKYDTYHGESLSVIWPAWARYVYKSDVARFARYAKNVWDIEKDTPEESAIAGIEATEVYFKSVGMPICFGDLEIGIRPDSELQEMAAAATHKNTTTLGSFVVLDEDALCTIYQGANV